MVYRRWNIKRPAPQQVKMLQAGLGIPGLACGVLAARGACDLEKAAGMLGEGAPLSDPLALKDMKKLVTRVRRAVDEGEKIVVYGDYDVDGVTATALMVTYLESIGANVYFKLPSRREDGYGLSAAVIEQLAARGVSLIITVDNGISAAKEIALAKEKGMDVVVTDHHLPPPTLPPAEAVVDPLREDDESCAKNLCGAGVAFKAICAIEGCAPEELLDEYGDLAAIGTVGDNMEMTGENRTLVRAGLAALAHTQRPGLAALIEKAGLADKRITEEQISFVIAPRLNAAGRMDEADLALGILLEEDEATAIELAEELEHKNQLRQAAERDITEKLEEQLRGDTSLETDRVLVLWGEGYHPGVIGIAASRMAEKYAKPVIIFTVDAQGEARGSGRSWGDFSLYQAIASCAPMLLRFGGHAMAAGLSVKCEALPAFRKAVNEWARQHQPVTAAAALEIDLSVRLEKLTVEAVESAQLLAPFGQGNPQPLYVVENAVIDGVFALSEGRHTRLRLSQGSGVLYAVLFGISPGQLAYRVGDKVDAALELSVYENASGARVSARIVELRPAGLPDEVVEQAQWYAACQNGLELPAGHMQAICPLRKDVIELYREAAMGLPCDDLRPTVCRLGTQRTGRLLAAADILKELGHLVEDGRNSGVLRQSPEKVKRPLEESRLLARLEGKPCGDIPLIKN